MTTNTKTILSALLYIAEWAVVYLATVHGITGARNIIYALAVLNAITILTVASSTEGKEMRLRPYWQNACFTASDFMNCAWLTWFGWGWCATGYMIGAMVALYLRFGESKKAADEKAEN